MNEIKAQFTAETGIEVRASYAASAPLAQQIVHGADADLMLSADTQWIDFLAKEEYVARRKDVLGNRLVIVVPLDSKTTVASPRDLLSDSIKHVAVGEPKSVPAGKYAREALTRLGLWGRLETRLVPADDVRHALMYVESGAAEAGIVYATDAAASPRVKIAWDFPAELTGPIVYPLALLRHGAKRKPAEEFYQYLSSPQAAAVFQKFGFVVSPATSEANGGPSSPTKLSEWMALRLSFQVALVAALCSLPWATALAYLLSRRRFRGKWFLEVAIDLPLVLPPVVTGYLLLVAFNPHGALGHWLEAWFGLRIAFHWLGAALASAVVGFPLMVRAVRLAFEAVDPRLEMAARSLGASRLGAFFTVALPLARRGLIAGFMLAFARSLGEFGATIMVAGNTEGQTQTIPLAIYTLAGTPGGMEATWRLVGLSILLSCAALAASEWFQRRRPSDAGS